MKNRLLTLAGTFALLAVLGRFYAVPVFAQVRAAVVKSIDERGRTPYAQTSSCSTPASTVCLAFFPAVPSGKRLVVEHLNGVVSAPPNLLYISALDGNQTLIHYVSFQLQGSNPAGNSIYIANQPTLTYFEAGQSPQWIVNISSAAAFNSQLTITGYLVDLTQ